MPPAGFAAVRSVWRPEMPWLRGVISPSAVGLIGGNAVYAASQLGLVITVAKLGSVVQVGHFAYALAATAPIFILSQLQLRGLQATDAAGEYSFAEYFSLRLATTAAAFMGVVAIAFTTDSVPQRGVILVTAVAKAIESITDVAHGRFQQTHRLDVVSASFVVRGALGLVTFVAVFSATRDLVHAIAAMALCWMVSYVLIERRALREERSARTSRATLTRLYRLAMFAGPMGVVMALSSLNVQVPRYFIEATLGAAALGVFAGLAAIPLVGAAVVVPLCHAASARMARAFHDREMAAFRQAVVQLLVVAVGVGALITSLSMIVGDRLVMTLYSEEFAGHRVTLLALTVWGTLSYVGAVLGSAVTAARRLRIQVPVLGAGAVVTGLTAVMLVPRFGLAGAAVAASTGMLVQVTWLAAVLKAAVEKGA